jgi:transposase
MFKQNRLGGNFENGKHTPRIVRQRIVSKYGQGVSISQISKDLQVTERGVRKIISSYEETKSIDPKLHLGQDHYKTTDNVLQHIEYIKTQKPSTYGKEIKDKLLDLGVCDNDTVPSRQTISHVLRHELGFTRKRLTVIPEESLTVAAQAKQVRYLEEIADFPARNIHFMDECSVDRTSGNRTYGHSLSGEPAIEICRYSSNAKFTVNLLCGYFGVDHYNIIEGASNGLELLQFFIEAMDERYDNGIPKIAAGDVVVMDNCGFHHARHVEPILRQILLEHEVTLVFQPPYSPELNPCEYAFNHIKQLLKRNERFTSRFTELAIVNALEFVTPTLCSSFFRKCGYAI